MKFTTLFAIAAFAASGQMVQAWSAYCYDCSSLLPLSDFTYSCCPEKIGTDEVYHCWDMTAAQKNTFLSCCKKYGKCGNAY